MSSLSVTKPKARLGDAWSIGRGLFGSMERGFVSTHVSIPWEAYPRTATRMT